MPLVVNYPGWVRGDEQNCGIGILRPKLEDERGLPICTFVMVYQTRRGFGFLGAVVEQASDADDTVVLAASRGCNG
jgi:hypothetical protein